MKTFVQFINEAYDPEVQGRSQIRKTGEGGRVGANRKKSEPEKRRMKAAGGGKMVPAKDYNCLLYTSPSPRDAHESRMPSSA